MSNNANMNSSGTKLKRKANACQIDCSKTKEKTPKTVGVRVKKEPEKLTKIKQEEPLSPCMCHELAKKIKLEADSEQKPVTTNTQTTCTPCTCHDLEGEPSAKRIKLKADSEQKPVTTNTQTSVKEYKKHYIVEGKEPIALSTWYDSDYLSQSERISTTVAANLIELFEEGNTIPFIARYRGHLTRHLTADKLRKIKATYDYIELVHKKALSLIKEVQNLKESTPEVLSCIQSARTVEELEFIGSQFKTSSKRTLAQRARELGLEAPAKLLLEGTAQVNLNSFVKLDVAGLKDTKEVKLGIQHVIADIISKSPEVHRFLEKMYSSHQVLLKSKFKSGMSNADKESSKYGLYGDFTQSLTEIQPHQTLAINRGESENELTVKIVIPDFMWQPLKNYCNKAWLKSGSNYELRRRIFSDSVDDAIKRLLEPLAIRRLRANLKKEAEDEAVSVFGTNLRQLLMTPPCSGHVVMGIDPGFSYGCKVAVVSPTGELLNHDVFFLRETRESKRLLRNLVLDYKIDVIALGNGKGCRETEVLLSNLIKHVFKFRNVSYTIVNEQGVSIYSCSSVAEEEFPKLDPKIVSAISLARRLQNPLSELVKVEPKHLGVGMYQHDVGKKRLESTLEDVVSECVSFVGVDINSASLHLLRRVAGLTEAKAQEIIKYRTENCSFKSREDLKKVKGIKTKTFQQCAGFIRVIPATARCTKHKSCKSVQFNPLDETCIHPESYDVALKIINRFRLSLDRLGEEDFVQTVERKRFSEDLQQLTKDCNCSSLEVELILDSLAKRKDFDLRSLSPGPIFRRGIINLEDIYPGEVLEGVVRNVVSFGAFVDVGVGNDGLIHRSQMANKNVQLNDKVKVEVISKSLDPLRIELKLLSLNSVS